MIELYNFQHLIEKEGRDEFITSRYRKFAWEFCEILIAVMRVHRGMIILNAFVVSCVLFIVVLLFLSLILLFTVQL